jgi:hypothetical protein
MTPTLNSLMACALALAFAGPAAAEPVAPTRDEAIAAAMGISPAELAAIPRSTVIGTVRRVPAGYMITEMFVPEDPVNLSNAVDGTALDNLAASLRKDTGSAVVESRR